MEEQQVDAEPGVVQAQAALAADKGEVVTKLQKPILQTLSGESGGSTVMPNVSAQAAR